jgi:hypothetical protein
MESDIIARIDKYLSDCEIAGWEDVLFPEKLLMECKAEIVAASSRWIPVSEELPEADQPVLVWNSGGDCLKPWAWWQICDYKDGKWREQDERDEYPGVTHWMPLPQEPHGWEKLALPREGK